MSLTDTSYDAQSQSDNCGDSEEDLIVFQTRRKKTRRKICLFILLSSLVLTSLILTGVGLFYHNQPPNVEYPGNEEILQIMESITSSLSGAANSSIVTVGMSVENNPIKLLRISPLGAGSESELNNSCASSPLVWVVCGVHAREWTSPLACLEIIKNIRDIFLSQYGSHEDDVLKKFRYNFIVVGNPDGYIYSMSDVSRRMTRKNRAKTGCPFSEKDGVDLNRNFATGFNQGDDCFGDPRCPFNSSACSITYGGSHPFSEPETRTIRDAMMAEVPWLSLSLHGNGNVWSAPYASQVRPAPGVDMEDLVVLTERIREQFGSNYSSGCSSCVMYRAGGILSDWVYEELHVNRSYVHELKALCDPREAGEDGGKCLFQPDIKDAVRLILPEAWYGFKELLKIAHKKDC